ncbi:hypothetical protein BT93_D0773 [Corymbia citriodora subsp. variegata]|nr:hypothetical protein BT93_D0773 [Corymbia citriodora subsp. variegata]
MRQCQHLFLVIFCLLCACHSSARLHHDCVRANKVCKQPTNCTLCITSLYPDPGVPDADDYTLVCIVSGLVYCSASSTQDHTT